MLEPHARQTLSAADGAELQFCRHGGQLLSWRAGGVERLFLSSRVQARPGAAIRGGVPIVFPQFAGCGPLPKHGFARLSAWHLGSSGHTQSGAAWVELHLPSDADSERVFPYPFHLVLRLEADAKRLELALSVFNPGIRDLVFTAALHTYLAVDELAEASLKGLEGARYHDALTGQEAVETGACLGFAGELDRVYRTNRPLMLRDGAHRLAIRSEGFGDTVVWNPGADKGAALNDLGEGEWRRFVCVEAAAVSEPAVVRPGCRWLGRQSLQLL